MVHFSWVMSYLNALNFGVTSIRAYCIMHSTSTFIFILFVYFFVVSIDGRPKFRSINRIYCSAGLQVTSQSSIAHKTFQKWVHEHYAVFTVLHRPIQLQVDINIEIRKTSGQRILTRKCRIAPNGVSAYIRSQRRSSSDHGIDAARALLRYGAGDR